MRQSIQNLFVFNYAFLMVLLSGMLSFTSKKVEKNPAVLIFSKTNGFHHASIPAGIAAIQRLGKENSFDTDTTTDANYFTPELLKKYSAVVFLSTTQELLNDDQKEALKGFIRTGHGFAGIHAAADAEYHWPWYGRLVGGYFNGHPAIQQAVVHVVDANNPSTKGLPKEWIRTDEWYNFKDLGSDLHILLSIDENSYKGGTNGSYHPVAWYHSYDGGRAFYTALGHTEESFSDPLYLQHLLGGIQYAIGR